MLVGMNGSAEVSLVASTMALKKSMDIEQSMMAKLFGQTADINMQTPDKEVSTRITDPTQFIQNEALKLGKLDIYA
jgi:DNA modification methylase